jgi:hypothetical protein
VLMQRRDVEVTPEDLEAPTDDPREYRALRHNVRQVRREVDDLTAEIRRLEASVRNEYESSLSWRLTKPLRAGARRRRPGRLSNPFWPSAAGLAVKARVRPSCCKGARRSWPRSSRSGSHPRSYGS